MLRLNLLSPGKGAKKPSKRLGRGIGSGHGKTAGKGHKGQKARAGGKVARGFEGGQTPLYRRLPKFGFTSRTQKKSAEISTRTLNQLPERIVEINFEILKTYKLIHTFQTSAKIILKGDCQRPWSVTCARSIQLSKGAQAAIESAGGSVIS